MWYFGKWESVCAESIIAYVLSETKYKTKCEARKERYATKIGTERWRGEWNACPTWNRSKATKDVECKWPGHRCALGSNMTREGRCEATWSGSWFVKHVKHVKMLRFMTQKFFCWCSVWTYMEKQNVGNCWSTSVAERNRELADTEGLLILL